ncbi:MAG: ATP-binding protein [Lentisphaeria bacterium]
MQGVLIASADSAVRKSLRLILQPGKAVLEAATLSEALILAVSQKLDVILVDDLYSDGTAEDLIQRLHSLGYGVEIVPVLLSLDPLYRDPYRPYGIQFFVAKPFDAFHVNHALEGIERLRRAATGQPPVETAVHSEPARGDTGPDHASLGDTDLREVTLRLQRLLARSCDRRELLDAFCECLQEQFEANTVAVLLPADGTPEFRIAAGNVSPAVADQFHIPLGEPLLAALTRAGEPVRLLDPHQVGAPNLMAAARYGERLGAEWLCPLVSRGCLAAIVALSRPHRQDPSPAFTSLLRVFLAFFGRALENADRVGRLDHARVLFSGLVAGLPAGLVAVGPDGRVRHLNPAGAALLGVAEDGCGLPVERLDSRLAGIVHSLLAGHGATPALPATFTCHDRELAVTASWPAGDGLGLCLMTAAPAAGTPATAAAADPAGAAEAAPAAPAPVAGLEPVWRSMGRVLGHNFKNALVPLKTCADLLPERHADPEFRDSFVNVVRDSVGRLDGWIEELLRFGELDAAGATSRERLSLRELAGMAGQMAQGLTGATGIDLRNDIPDSLWVTGNRALLLQAFQELWKNAFAATEGAAQPAVAVRAESDGHCATVIFADNGRGLEAAVSRHLFQPFNSNRLSGLGLGLAYVQRVLALHGGMLAAGPGPDGAGTAFRVTLPQPEALTAAG